MSHEIKYCTGTGALISSVLIIDELPVFGRGLAQALEAGSSTLVTSLPGGAHDVLTTLDLAGFEAVFIGCCNIQDLSGVRGAVQVFEKVRIPVFVMIDEFKYQLMSSHIPRSATLILRNSEPDKVRNEVAKVLRGRFQFRRHPHLTVSHSGKASSLSPAEKRVLQEILKGYSLTEIAGTLRKSIKTVSAQKQSAMRRLGLKNTQELFFRLMTPDLSEVLNDRK